MKNARGFRDEIVGHAVHRERDRFIEQLRSREDEILQLAAKQCSQSSARFFKSRALGEYYARGSYNALFFVELADDSKCVARVGVDYDPYSENPGVFRGERRGPPLDVPDSEYVNGKVLSPAAFESLASDAKTTLYESLADIYMQLRRQEFPSIGRLKAGASGVTVKAATVDINMMLLEGLDPLSIQEFYYGESGILTSANQYTKMQLSIGFNAFVKSRNGADAELALECLYNHHLFNKHVRSWLLPELDQGPFVLVHGDLHLSNLMLDDDAHVISVIDWEWSRIVPVQFLTPPLWISGSDTVQLAHPNSWRLFQMRQFADFLRILKVREREKFQNTTLFDEWSQRTQAAEPLVANALENWTDIDWFAHRWLGKAVSPADEVLLAFADEDPLRGLLADMKERDNRKYQQELDGLDLMNESDEGSIK